MKRVRNEKHLVSSIAFAVALALAVPAAIAQGNKPPNPGGGNKPPGGETATNNLSYPAVEIDGAGPLVSAIFKPSASTTPGVDFSYGCPDLGYPENGATYPNFSCMDGATYLTREQCAAPSMPCAGRSDIERIYWQKTTNNDWTSDTSLSPLGVSAPNVDWADNLETQTWWDTASIRVETTPFGAVETQLRGLQMWHVVGQGQTELWGVRATEPEAAGASPLPYVYNSDYAILHTTKARLNIAKVSGPNDVCPTAAPTTPPSVTAGTFTYTDTGGYWDQAYVLNNNLRYLYDIPYTAELNIGGKYVYGYNWQLRRDSVPAAVGKTGWWRLTFYTKTSETATSAVTFPDAGVTFAPPLGATATPTPLPTSVTILATEGGSLYVPNVIAGTKQLSYIDICISSSKGGGGKKGPK